MSQILTDQDFANAKRDISDIDKSVNTKSIVDPRWGGDFKSLPLVSEEWDAKTQNAQNTINDWQSAINTIVVNDGVPALAVSTANGSNQQAVNDLGGVDYWASRSYQTNNEVRLADGTVVISTIDNNSNNPNSDMTGWRKKNSADQIFDESGLSQQEINNGVESIADLIAIPNPKNGSRVFVKSYHVGLGVGGGDFYYDATKSSVNDGVVVFNGWVRKLENNILTPYMAGAKADYVDQSNKGIDDSASIQKVVAYFAENPCVIEFDPLAKHYVANPVIIPNYTEIIGNGAQLFGNGRLNDCFYTGYYVNGVLTPLYDKPNNTKLLTNTKIKGFRYAYFKSSMKLRGMTQGCAVEDVRSMYCDQHLWSREHYFCTFRQSYADHCGTGTAETPVDDRTPVYDLWELNGMINIENIQCSSASLAYTFYSTQATVLKQLDAESCATALRLRGDIENPEISGCYFENCGTVLDVSGSQILGGSMHNNFINHCDVGILATGASGYLNEFDNRWTGTIGKRSSGTAAGFRLYSKEANKFIAANATYPADNTPNGTVTNKNEDYATGSSLSEQILTVYDQLSGINMVQAKSYMGSTVPFVYFGKYPTISRANSIPFCSHIAGAVQGDNTFSIRITTSIAYSEFVRGDFALHVATTDDDRNIFGKFFGLSGVIEYNGFSGFTPTITIENVSGVIVIVLSGIKNTNNSNSYTCRGIVKLS